MTGIELLRESGAIITQLESPEGMDTEELDSRLGAWLDAQEDKIAAYRFVVQRIDAEDELLKAIGDRIASKRKYLARQKDGVRSLATMLLVDQEHLTGEGKVKRPEFTAWLAESEAVEVKVEPAKLPKAFRRVVVEADRAGIKAALKAGKKVKGCAIITSRSVRFR